MLRIADNVHAPELPSERKKAFALKIWTVSDLHTDYSENLRWVTDHLSERDYRDDLLIVAGDISDHPLVFRKTLQALQKRFHTVFFVVGNHDLWVRRKECDSSLDAFHECLKIAEDYGIRTTVKKIGDTWIVPLQGWYDYSFGAPSKELKLIWGDFRMCQWPSGYDPEAVTAFFTAQNTPHLSIGREKIVSFSHFLPRTDLIPIFVPATVKALLPVMGTTILENQIRTLQPAVHIYGHSHFNRDVKRGGIRYVNNAFGYPHEIRIARKKLLCLGDA